MIEYYGTGSFPELVITTKHWINDGLLLIVISNFLFILGNKLQ